MRGGVRSGAGRPRGSRTVKVLEPPTNMTGIEWLQRVVNDPHDDVARRDRAAAVLATYESRVSPQETKRQKQEREADEAWNGSKWQRLLDRRQPVRAEWERLSGPLVEDDE